MKKKTGVIIVLCAALAVGGVFMAGKALMGTAPAAAPGSAAGAQNTSSSVADVPATENLAPTVQSFAFRMAAGEKESLTGNVLQNSTPGDGTQAQHRFAWGGEAASYGTLQTQADGTFTYTLNTQDKTVRGLAAGATCSEYFTYTYTDTDGDVAQGAVTITITGAPTSTNTSARGSAARQTVGASAAVQPASNETPATPPTPAAPVLSVQSFTHIFVEDSGVDDNDPIYTYTVNVLDGSTLGVGTAAQHTFAWDAAANSPYGTYSMNSGGIFTFSMENSRSAVQALYPGGGDKTETYGYTYTDAAGNVVHGAVTLTFVGVGDAPNASHVYDLVEEDDSAAFSTINGTIMVGYTLGDGTAAQHSMEWTVPATATNITTHPDGAVSFDTNYATVILRRDGTYSYTLQNTWSTVRALAEGDTVEEVFGFTLFDASFAYSDSVLTVTVKGIDNTP